MLDDPKDRHRPRLEALESAILQGPGVLPPEARGRRRKNDGGPDMFAAYVDTIHRHAYRVTDRMVASLAEAGADDDAVFEIECRGRLRRGPRASGRGAPGIASGPGRRLMRLEAVARGRGLGAKAKFAMIRLLSGAPTLDVVKTLSFRPAFFGDPFNQLIQEVMRGPSEWTVGERELFAAFVSARNRCEF